MAINCSQWEAHRARIALFFVGTGQGADPAADQPGQPLLIMQRYGLQPGAGVVLELRTDEIRILSAVVGREEIENRALRYLLAHLGDATTVDVERDDGNWRVSVYGAGIADPLGQLVYSPAGELLLDRSTPVEEMHRGAIEVQL